MRTATAAVFLPDGQRVVSVSEDHFVRVWDLKTEKSTGPPMLPKMIYRISLSANGRQVLFGCDQTLYRWDPDGALHRTRLPVTEAIEQAVMLPDGRAVLALLDGTIRVWDFDPDRELYKIAGNGQAVLALAVTPDGKHVVSGGRDKIARLWPLPDR
jgi:WD40 repeat protein